MTAPRSGPDGSGGPAPDDALAVLADLRSALPPEAESWLVAATSAVQAEGGSVELLFPVAGRRCGQAPVAPGWQAADAARMLLLTALPLEGTALLAVLERLYRHGDAAERRAVLRALPVLEDRLGPSAAALVEDALRTNDPRLVRAALGAYGARHLNEHAYRHGVLKCVFLGIPLGEISGLDDHTDPELIRMLTGYAAERAAAGRHLSPDVRQLIEATTAEALT